MRDCDYLIVGAGSAESELGPINTIDGLIIGKLYGAARAKALARDDVHRITR